MVQHETSANHMAPSQNCVFCSLDYYFFLDSITCLCVFHLVYILCKLNQRQNMWILCELFRHLFVQVPHSTCSLQCTISKIYCIVARFMIFVISEGDVILLGTTNVFRFNHPREAAELREKRKVSTVQMY